MIRNILYVEDGSVDIDALEEKLSSETLIVPYRQGSICPQLKQLTTPLLEGVDWEIEFKKLQEKTDRLIKSVLSEKKITMRLRKKIDDFGVNELGW